MIHYDSLTFSLNYDSIEGRKNEASLPHLGKFPYQIFDRFGNYVGEKLVAQCAEGRCEMNAVLILLGVVMFSFALYLLLRIKTTEWATEDRFFTSPAFGRIRARIRAGKIIQYIANLKGLDVHINEDTGLILSGEEKAWSFWWWAFGVRFIGLDDVHEYDIEVTKIDADGKAVTKTERAHSIHYSESYHIVISGEESLEGTPLGLHLRFTLKTRHAGQCLKFKNNWVSVAYSAIKAATRDFVGKRDVRSLLKMQTELPDSTPSAVPPPVGKEIDVDFVQLMKSLNTSIRGNPGLIDTLGQEIVSVNLESIEIEDEIVAESLRAEEKAIENGKAAVAKAAQAANEATENQRKRKTDADTTLYEQQKAAEAEQAHGIAENNVLRDRAHALGGPDGLVQIRKWEAIGGLKELKGTLVISDKDGQPPSIIVPSTTFQKGD